MKNTVLLLMALVSVLLPSCSRAENIYIHQSFKITQSELDSTLTKLPEDIIEKIKADRKDFLEKLIPLISIYDDFLILADKNHPLPEISMPEDLIELDSSSFKLNKKGMKIRKPVYEALIKMIADAEKINLDLMVSSAFRSYRYQEKIYNYYVSVYGQEETDKFSARPGTSQHQLGTALDFGSITEEYAFTDEGKWQTEYASEYGFSLSYPDGYEELTGYNYEPWHFRYITTEGCIMQDKYFSGIQQYMLEYLFENISFFRLKQIRE